MVKCDYINTIFRIQVKDNFFLLNIVTVSRGGRTMQILNVGNEKEMKCRKLCKKSACGQKQQQVWPYGNQIRKGALTTQIPEDSEVQTACTEG